MPEKEFRIVRNQLLPQTQSSSKDAVLNGSASLLHQLIMNFTIDCIPPFVEVDDYSLQQQVMSVSMCFRFNIEFNAAALL